MHTSSSAMLGLVTAVATADPGMTATVAQSARELPVHATVDVVVVGGTSAGVEAATTAAKAGASVFLVAPRFYLGEDLCGTLRLDPGGGAEAATDLQKALFAAGTPSPARVKGVLTKALVDGGVRFLYASHATDLLRDGSGKPAGVVIDNRAGRQAIVAKVVIDATSQAWFCRGPAGCATSPWPGGKVAFEQSALWVQGAEGDRGKNRRSNQMRVDALEIDLPDLSYLSLGRARDVARERTFKPEMLRQAETLFFVPPATVVCRKRQDRWEDSVRVDLDHFRPADTAWLYVLGGWADIPRPLAAALLRPAGFCPVAAAIGQAAAVEAKGRAELVGVRVAGTPGKATAKGDVAELLGGSRPVAQGGASVPCEAKALPVLAEVDVLVVGGGTTGAPAAISAARQGARTLVIEFQEGLGGIGTIGQIGKPYHGRNVGFAKEVPFPDNIEVKMEWYRREIAKAGGEIWLRAMGAGAVVDGYTVIGAVICTPERRGIVLAKVVIDATGNGDVAVAAGAEYMYGTIEQGDIALQGTGFSQRIPNQSYRNSDYLLVDEADMVDVWNSLSAVYLRSAGSGGKQGGKGGGNDDWSTHILTRERRRVVGDVIIRYVEQLAGRTYQDAIVLSQSDYDSHGYPTDPFFFLFPHTPASLKANHPAPGGPCYSSYRAFTPKGLEGILVAGLGISMDRDVTAMVRMQHDIASQGYALGWAAATAAEQGIPPRRINVKALQKHLIGIGALPAEAASWRDNFPLPKDVVAKAVADFGKATEPHAAGQPLAVILTHAKTAQPLVEEAYAKAQGQAKLFYARVLAVFGDKRVVPFLVEELGKVRAWDAKVKQGHMADHAHLPTPVDSLVLALGYAKDRSATPALARMIAMLRDAPDATLSHHRAVALAAERLGDPALARPLAEVLLTYKPGKSGASACAALTDDVPEQGNRSKSIAQICVARALYRLGDHDGVGKRFLEAFRKDKRGLFARHAAALLEEEP